MSRKPLLVIFITVFVDLLGFGIVLPLLPRYAAHFLPSQQVVATESAIPDSAVDQPTKSGATPEADQTIAASRKLSFADGITLGCLMAAFSAMQFLFAPLWGKLSDRIGRRPVLLVGLAGSALFYALFAMVTQWGNSGPILGLSPLTWLFITRIGAGIAGATIPTAQAYIADCTDEKSRGKGMAIIGAAFGIGFTFGPLLGSLFVSSEVSSAPSSAPGYVAAILSAFAFVVGLTSLPESLKQATAQRAATHGWLRLGTNFRVLAHRSLGPIIIAIFLTTFAFGQFETTLTMLTKQLKVSEKGNFYIFSYIGLVLTLSQGVLVRRLIPRLGEWRMALIGVILMTIGLMLIGQTVASGSLRLLIAVLPCVVIGYSATTPALLSLLSLNSSDDRQGEVLGVGQSMSALARIAGPVAGLSLQTWGLAMPYWIGAAMMALGIMLVIRLKSVVTTLKTQG